MPFLALVLVGLVSSGLLGVFPPIIRFLLVFVLFSFLPGGLFLNRFGWRHDGIRLSLAGLTGLSFFVAITWICGLAGMSFGGYLVVLQITAAAVFAVFFLASMRRDVDGQHVEGGDHSHGRRSTGVVYPVIAILVAVFFYFSPPTLSYNGDSFVHLGYLRGIIAENSLSPPDVLAPAVFARGENLEAGSDPRLGALHPFLAGMSALSSVEPLALWLWLPVALAPIAFLGFIAFARRLLPGGWFVAGAAVLFLMFQGGLGREFLGRIAYGQNLSLVFYWVLFVVCVEYAASKRNLNLTVTALLLVGGSLCHIDVAIHFGLMYAALLIFYRAFRVGPRVLLKLGITSVMCAGVVIAWKMASSDPAGNVMHTHPQGLLYFFEIGDRYFVPSPAEIVRQNGLLFFTGLLLIPFLPLLRKHRRHGWMTFALCVPPLITALNPWVAPFVYGKVHYLLHRFLLNIPALVITSLVIGSLISWGRRGNVWRKGIAVLLLFLWAKPFLLGTAVWYRDIRSVRFDGFQPPLSGDVANAIRFLNEKTEKGSVVLSDAMTSYTVSGFSHARVVAVLGQHGNPNDRYPIERLSAIHAVLSPYTTQIETVKAIERFDVDYVLVNGSFAGPVHGFMADWDPKVKPTLEKKLGNMKRVFKRVYETDRIIVYKVIGTSVDRVTWHPEAPFTREPEGKFVRCEFPAHHAGYEVTGIRIEPDVALPGERVNLTLVYRGRDDARPSFPLTLHIRFEEKAYFERARRYLGDKHVRRYRERRDGAFRRFRIDRKPFKGLYLPDEWPGGQECYDEFSARLPTDLNEGVYEVQLRLVEDTILPNFAVRDFFFNDDSFVGTPCGEIEIRKFLVRPGSGNEQETGNR